MTIPFASLLLSGGLGFALPFAFYAGRELQRGRSDRPFLERFFPDKNSSPPSGVPSQQTKLGGAEFVIDSARILGRERYRLGMAMDGIIFPIGMFVFGTVKYLAGLSSVPFDTFWLNAAFGGIVGSYVRNLRYSPLLEAGPRLLTAKRVEFGRIEDASFSVRDHEGRCAIWVETPLGMTPRRLRLITLSNDAAAEEAAELFRRFVRDHSPAEAWPPAPDVLT
jgi:hypothetical protein